MTTVYDVPAEALIKALAPKLAKLDAIKPPAWAPHVTTGVHCEKPPVQEDWWEIRAAAVLRRVYMNGPLGTERLRALYGGPKNRGSKPNRAAKGSGSIARETLKQLEAAGLLESVKGEGRRTTPQGQKLANDAAHEVMKGLAKELPALAKY